MLTVLHSGKNRDEEQETSINCDYKIASILTLVQQRAILPIFLGSLANSEIFPVQMSDLAIANVK
jgi:hypothetical protein